MLNADSQQGILIDMNTDETYRVATPPSAAQLVAEIERLIAFPEVWLKINRLINDERPVAEIAGAIEMDTDLSARLLRIVNSSFYRLASPVETISRAVTIIGTLDLRDLAMLTVAKRVFTGIPPDLMDLHRFWQQAISVGVVAGVVGRKRHLLHAERTFVMGVIHNVGQLVICQYLPEQARETLLIANDDHEVLNAAEQEILGFTHQEVGLALLRRWGLPYSVCQVAGYHHEPDQTDSSVLEVCIVHVAAQLVDGNTLGLETAEILERIHPVARDMLEVTPAFLDEVIEEGSGQIAEVAERFLSASTSKERR